MQQFSLVEKRRAAGGAGETFSHICVSIFVPACVSVYEGYLKKFVTSLVCRLIMGQLRSDFKGVAKSCYTHRFAPKNDPERFVKG